MSKPPTSTAGATPVAPQVDPATPVPAPPAPEPTPVPVPAPEPEPAAFSGATVPGVDTAVPGSDPGTHEKIKVRTSGEFGLMDPWTGTWIAPGDKATEVVKTTFVAERLELGQLIEA